MPKYVRGIEPVAFRIGTIPVLRKHLGSVLLWDGTRSAVAPAIRATASASARAAVVGASSTATTLAATADVAAYGADGAASASGAAIAAVATAAASAHAPSADALATAVPAAATAIALDANVEQNFDATANATAAEATGTVSSPAAVGTADAAADASAATMTTIVYDAQGDGSGSAIATAATATATALSASTSATAAALSLAATAAVAAGNATPFADALAAAAPATAATAANGGTVTAVNFQPSGMNKNGSWPVPTSYATVPSWTADTATYPGSTVSSDGLVANAASGSATIATSLTVSNSSFSQVATVTLRIYKNGTTLLHTSTGTNIPANSSAAVTASISGQTVASGDIITVQAIGSSVAGTRTVTAGWVRIT